MRRCAHIEILRFAQDDLTVHSNSRRRRRLLVADAPGRRAAQRLSSAIAERGERVAYELPLIVSPNLHEIVVERCARADIRERL